MFGGDWLGRRALLSPTSTAITDTIGDRVFTYEVWNQQANRTANWLRTEMGVGRGDRVAVLAKNSMAYLDLWFACGKLGAVLQNLNWRLAVPELGAILADAEPALLLYGGAFLQESRDLRRALANDSLPFVALEDAAEADDPRFERRESCSADPPPVLDLAPSDPWVICYTGGTTGLPKGAILTHGTITWNAINTVVSWGLRPDDVAALNAPLFHTGGLNVFTAPLVYVGGASVLCRGFDVDQLFDLIEQRAITVFFGVPTMFTLMQEHPRWPTVDFSGCRIVISGGAPCPQPIFERFWAKGVDFKTGYGLTEAGPNNFWLPPEMVRTKPGAVGFPLMHVQARLVDDDGAALGADEVGELLLRGGHVSPGYWRNPEATGQALRDGWLHTGDLARRDQDGCYTIVGRRKEMFISGGENVYPAEVESAIHSHPAVVEAALVPVADAVWGEVGRAFVVVRAGHQLTPEGLTSYLRQQLAGYKIPRQIHLVSALPKTPAGKIDKKILIQRMSSINESA